MESFQLFAPLQQTYMMKTHWFWLHGVCLNWETLLVFQARVGILPSGSRRSFLSLISSLRTLQVWTWPTKKKKNLFGNFQPDKQNILFSQRVLLQPAHMLNYSSFLQVATYSTATINSCREARRKYISEWLGSPGYLFIYPAHDWLNSMSANEPIKTTSDFLTVPKHPSSKLHVTARAWRVKERQSWKASSYLSCILSSFAYHSFLYFFPFFLRGWKQSFVSLNIWDDRSVTVLLTLRRLQRLQRYKDTHEVDVKRNKLGDEHAACAARDGRLDKLIDPCLNKAAAGCEA